MLGRWRGRFTRTRPPATCCPTRRGAARSRDALYVWLLSPLRRTRRCGRPLTGGRGSPPRGSCVRASLPRRSLWAYPPSGGWRASATPSTNSISSSLPSLTGICSSSARRPPARGREAVCWRRGWGALTETACPATSRPAPPRASLLPAARFRGRRGERGTRWRTSLGLAASRRAVGLTLRLASITQGSRHLGTAAQGSRLRVRRVFGGCSAATR